MPRRILSGGVYMVTRRCTQRQFPLRLDPATTNAFAFCLALAAHRTQMQIVAFLAHSNHHHTVVGDTQGRMPEFLEYFHKLVAKHQNALRGRWENFWASEATSVVGEHRTEVDFWQPGSGGSEKRACRCHDESFPAACTW